MEAKWIYQNQLKFRDEFKIRCIVKREPLIFSYHVKARLDLFYFGIQQSSSNSIRYTRYSSRIGLWFKPTKATVNTVQDSHQDIVETVMEKKMKARGPGHLQGSGKAIQSSGGACKIDYWMWGLDEKASHAEVRTSDSHAWHIIGQG